MSENGNVLLSLEDAVKGQRTEKGLEFDRFMKKIAQLRADRSTAGKEKLARLNASVLAIKGVSPASVHNNAFMSEFSLKYANDEYIGERLLTVVPVSKRSDDYVTYPKRERLAFPDDSLSTRSKPNEISETRSSDNYSVKDYALMNFVSQDTLDNEDGAFDEMLDLVESVNEGVAFKRELRIAAKLTDTANFGSNYTTLSGGSLWSAGGSNPIKNIQDGLAALWMGPGQTSIVAYCSLDVLNTLSRHPAILDLFKYNSSGLATRQQIAQFFGFSELLVGAARKDTANEGQTATYGRVWGNHFGMVRTMNRPSKRTAAFGATFRLNGDPTTTQWFDQSPGKKGGYFAKVGVSEDHKIIASDAGYLISTAI